MTLEEKLAAFCAPWQENEIEQTLDRALEASQRFQKVGRDSRPNVLIRSVFGSAKGAYIYDWAARNDVNILYLDAWGFTDEKMYGRRGPNGWIYPTTFDPLDRPNSVLFIDNINYLTDLSLRSSLLYLPKNNFIEGNGSSGMQRFPNLLFTVACEHVEADTRSSIPLAPDDRSIFAHHVQHELTAADAMEYFSRVYTCYIAERYLADDNEKYVEEVLPRHLSRLALVSHLLLHPDFHFDTEKGSVDDTPFSLLALQTSIRNYGKKERFLQSLGTSWFRDEVNEMLKTILADYDEKGSLEVAKAVVKMTYDEWTKDRKTPDFDRIKAFDEYVFKLG